MARSSGGGSRFASSNLNDLYGKQVFSGIAGKSRYSSIHGGSHHHGGMLVLARPVRNNPPGNKAVKPPQPKLTVPAPVNLPSLRKEHAGNDPNITLVGGSGSSGWSKQQVQIQQQQQQQQSSSSPDQSLADQNHIKSNGGWGSALQSSHLPQAIHSDSSPRPGRYTPPGARGGVAGNPAAAPAAPLQISPATAVVLRGEDFPTLQAAAPFNPVPSQQRMQQRQKEKQREIRQQQQKLQQLSHNQVDKDQGEDGYKVVDRPSSPVLTLQPQSTRQGGGGGGGGGGGFRDDLQQRNSYFPFKENRKPNDLSLRPGPLLHLSHTSNWAEDERETGSSASKAPEWEEGPRYHHHNNHNNHNNQAAFSRPPFQRDMGSGSYRRDPPSSREYGRRDMHDFGGGMERDERHHSGRSDWNSGRNGGGGFGFSEDVSRDHREPRNGWGSRERDGHFHSNNYAYDGFSRESSYHKSGGGGGGERGRFGVRNGAFDLPVRVRSQYSEDTFIRDFPELDLRFDSKYKMRRRKGEVNEASYRDLERESFESELERVQKEQEQERQKKLEDRERAIEFARKEQEERERLAREEEDRQRRIEEESREAAALAEQEASESVRKVEEARRAREEEKRKMLQEEETRLKNARQLLIALEERMSVRGHEQPSAEIHNTATRFEEDDDRRFPSPRIQHEQSNVRSRSGDISRSDSFRKEREDRWLPNGDARNVYSPRTSMDQSFFDEERRWNRRSREGRPFSPPSPTSYGGGYDSIDGLPYGRLRLPKQPRVPPPPSRTQIQKPSSSVFSRNLAASHEDDTEPVSVSEAKAASVTMEDADIENAEAAVADEMVAEGDTGSFAADDTVVDSAMDGDEQDFSVSAVQSPIDEQDFKKQENLQSVDFVQESVKESPEVVDEMVDAVTEVSPPIAEMVQETGDGLDESKSHVESFEEGVLEESLQTADMGAELSELVDSLVVVQKEAEAEEAVQLEVAVAAEEQQQGDKGITVVVAKPEGTQVVAEPSDDVVSSRPLLPSPPLQTQQHPMHQNFHQLPPFMPFDPRPRMQPDRPMTLQFGLLPGTSLLQGSIPAIQIGSIQMPLQLHPPIGHHVAHLQPPPQFQFGQIGQQAPLLPFTVHPQAMMQPSMHMEGGPGQFRMQHPDRTFWGGHYVSRKNGKSEEKVKTELQEPSESDKARQAATDLGPSERLFEAPGAAVQGFSATVEAATEEDDFIEVRSKRQLLNDRREQKEKQVKPKPKYMKTKEQVAKQKNAAKSSQVSSKESGKMESTSLRNCSLDAVVTTTRTRQASLSCPEVGFEKRTKSPQPQINPLVPEAPAFPSIVAEGQNPPLTNGPVAWGFIRPDQEAAHKHLEVALKPARYEAVQQQPLLSDPTLEASSSSAKDKGPGPAVAPGPINSLLAGEKIQFGAVTMPAFVSPVPWLGAPRPEVYRKEISDDTELTSFGKGKRLRETDDGSSCLDSEAEAEAAASAVAVAAISNDDYVHNTDQLAPPHGVIGSASNKSSPAGIASQPTQSAEIDEPISVSLPADLSVDMPLRGPPHSVQHLPSIPGSFPGMEMGALLGAERPSGPNWQHHDSFYGGPHSYAGPFINHGPIPSIPPHTLVYTSPFGGQFGQLGVSYMGPAHMPQVKQPDWKHTPSSSGGSCISSSDIGGLGGGMHYAQHNNRHLPHDPSVVPVVPPGPFDVYRDLGFQSQWSHVPGPHAPMPGFPMQLRHPHPAYHHHMQQQQQHHPGDMMNDSSIGNGPVEVSDQFPDELGLGDSLSTSSDANSSFVMQQTPAKPSSPIVSSLPAGRSNRPVPGSENGNNNNSSSSSRPNSGNAGGGREMSSGANFQPHSYVSTVTGSRRPIGGQQDKRHFSQQQGQGKPGGPSSSAAGAAAVSGWGNQNRKATQGGRPQSEKNSSVSPAAKLKQVYVVKPTTTTTTVAVGGMMSNLNNSDSCSEMFTADARHM